ncbi:hypothetical protein V500_02894 [Pseudogymnoascus sp. VKM F-4518 (FW-2643)]|nr:hypothetical protein V500_02894 [Pseudogymnoascus sp. VKM F-4518 (FW-2643)]
MISQLLKPNRAPLIPGYTKLPPFDQTDNRFVCPVTLVFRVESADSRDSMIQDLQDGLINTIEEMPFLAADVVPDNRERGTAQLETVEGGGLWFHVRDYPELDIEVLEHRKFAPASLPAPEIMPEPRNQNWERCPVLNIQATFITGGLILVNKAHAQIIIYVDLRVTDPPSFTAVAEGRLVSEVMNPESLDRTQAFATHGSGDMHISDFANYTVRKDGLVGDRLRELVRIALEGNTSHPALETLCQLTTTYWNVSQESLQATKLAAPPSASEAPGLTDKAVLSALLWRHISRARQLHSRGIKTTSVVNMVNIRRRLRPPLPLDYTGNAVVVGKATVSAADVETKMHLHELARRVSESIDWWTSERIWGYIGALDSTLEALRVGPDVNNFRGPDLEITDNGSNDMMEMEWGPDLGAMLGVRIPNIPTNEGWVMVLPSKKDGPLEVLIGLDRETLGRLQQDEEWNSFATMYE